MLLWEGITPLLFVIKLRVMMVLLLGKNSHGQLGISSSSSTKSIRAADGPAKSSPTTCCDTSGGSSSLSFNTTGSLRRIALVGTDVGRQGTVYSWGCSDRGRLGQGRAAKRSSDVGEPARVNGMLAKLVTLVIACGAWHSTCIAANESQVASGIGRVFMWGTGIYDQLGVGKMQVTFEQQPVRLPPRELDDEVLPTRLACGTHHTAALTVDNRIFTWGSTRAFNGVPTELRLAGGERCGRVASIACGRTFTVFNTVSRDVASYEWPEVSRLWREKPVVIPHLDFSKVPTLPLCTSDPLPPFSKGAKVIKPSTELPSPVRLKPFADRCAREEVELREAKRIDDQLFIRCVDCVGAVTGFSHLRSVCGCVVIVHTIANFMGQDDRGFKCGNMKQCASCSVYIVHDELDARFNAPVNNATSEFSVLLIMSFSTTTCGKASSPGRGQRNLVKILKSPSVTQTLHRGYHLH
ncbi:LOW QUALITY PROTEIN: hypothetical protein PHMEG_00036869 [Phytophthora megakarya]|uniref:Regulator of chromosome condensation (RCC1) n=1 Tax=Phytophthora megakarya TaxID=4795 RepID=A0A225UKC4_9STRA|nr:LOW QUALITY PROTEIN: hypothetical protein PHMEG_00036869 [Phytophthora megakarya]